MTAAIVVQSPQPARRLFVLFHGVGATPQDLVPLGGRLAREFPDAAIVLERVRQDGGRNVYR